MREVDNTNKQHSGIQCLEVLISRSNIVKSTDNLFWTLSAYSLENQPVKKNRELHDSEIFHFMQYDWDRTIRQLLEDRQVAFSIIQQFCPDSIYSDTTNAGYDTPDLEATFLSAVQSLPQTTARDVTAQDAASTLKESADVHR